jgi:dTMP kinase
MLITFYGVNNIGKSTQAQLLVDYLNALGHKSIYLKYPIYDLVPTGPHINSILRNQTGQSISEEELQMWFALNRHQFEPKLKQYLADGYIVIAEDYIGTSLAWGSAKGASLEWLKSLNQNLISEDLAILITGERSTSAIEESHIHENDIDLIQKVSHNLIALAKQFNWHIVERQELPVNTQELIFNIVKAHLT